MDQAIKNNLIGDELLVAVFSSGFPKNKNLKFNDESNIIKAFFKAYKKDKYKQLFVNYTFDSDGVFLSSREISEGLSNLHQSSLLKKLNPTFTYYQLSEGIDIRFKKYISKKLDMTTKNLIEELAKELKEEILNSAG